VLDGGPEVLRDVGMAAIFLVFGLSITLVVR